MSALECKSGLVVPIPECLQMTPYATFDVLPKIPIQPTRRLPSVGFGRLHCYILTLGGWYEAAGVHCGNRGRGGMVDCGARAAARDAGDSIPFDRIAGS